MADAGSRGERRGEVYQDIEERLLQCCYVYIIMSLYHKLWCVVISPKDNAGGSTPLAKSSPTRSISANANTTDTHVQR